MRYVFADYNATTPCSSEHRRAVSQLLERVSANPSSIHHLGRETKRLVEEAREKVAALFGAERNNLIFSSGATEANNLVIQGLVYERLARTSRPAKILVSAAEHASVYQLAETLQKRGLCELVYAPVQADGTVHTEALLQLLDNELALVSLIHVNNETGAINPIANLADLIRKRSPQAHIHVDAVQACGKMDIRWMDSSAIDTASASAHKIGGFTGIGCLYKKRQAKIFPLIYGGGQERGWRAGTENLPGILSFGLRAEEIAAQGDWLRALEPLKAKLLRGLALIPGAVMHGDPARSLASTVNFHIDPLSSEELLLAFDAARIAVSNGSACASGGGRPSHVLKAMGYTDDVASRSIRVSLGEGSKIDDVELILKTLLDLVRWKKRSNLGTA